MHIQYAHFLHGPISFSEKQTASNKTQGEPIGGCGSLELKPFLALVEKRVQAIVLKYVHGLAMKRSLRNG